MYVCMYVCVYVCMYVCMYDFVCVRARVCVCVCVTDTVWEEDAGKNGLNKNELTKAENKYND